MSKMEVTVANALQGDFSKPEVVAMRGSVNSNINILPVSATNSGFTFNWKAVPKSLINPIVRVRGTMNLVVSWNSNDTTARTLVVAPRQYPYTQLVSTQSTLVNNMNIGGQNYGQYQIAVAKYFAKKLEKLTWRAPTLPDYLADYNRAPLSSPVNVLGDAGQCIKGRGSYSGLTVSGTTTSANTTAVTANVAIDFDEVSSWARPSTSRRTFPT